MGRKRKNWISNYPMTCVVCGGGSTHKTSPTSGVLGTTDEKLRVAASMCKPCWKKYKRVD